MSPKCAIIKLKSFGSGLQFSMRLFLVRHGETEWNAERRAQGRSDIDLSEAGRCQAQALAQALAEESIAGVYSSPMQRAHATATIIAAPHGLPVVVHSGLNELDQGDLEGLKQEEMRERYPELLRRWVAGDTSVKLPGGESMEELQSRVWTAVQDILIQHQVSTVAIVSHNLAILAYICKALGVPLSVFRRLRQQTGSLNLFEVNDGHHTLVRFNDVCHNGASNRE